VSIVFCHINRVSEICPSKVDRCDNVFQIQHYTSILHYELNGVTQCRLFYSILLESMNCLSNGEEIYKIWLFVFMSDSEEVFVT